MMKRCNFGMKLRTAIIYPFVLIFDFVIVYLLIYPLIKLEDEDNIKNNYNEMYGTPMRFFVTTWNWCKVMIIENNQDMKEIWPILLRITVVALLPFTISLFTIALICCLC